MVGTIDGLFARIVKNNVDLLPISVPFEIISEQLWDNKIQKMFWTWRENLKEEEKIFTGIWASKFISWAIKVMGNTNSRLYWTDILTKSLDEKKFINDNTEIVTQNFLGEHWQELIALLQKLAGQFDFKSYGDKKWFQFVETSRQKIVNESNAVRQFLLLQNQLHEFKGLRAPTDEKLQDVAMLIKGLRTSVKDYGPAIEDWNKCLHDEGVKSWNAVFNLTKSFMHYLESNYGKSSGFCFADLSYYANIILKNKRSKLDLPFYVVVDELQDTSLLQLEQILTLAGNEAKNLYGVGDVKQAIYGFRGGESQVFFKFQSLVHNNKIDLLDNYRSAEGIVEFNNKLFASLFSKTQSLDQVAQSAIQETSGSAVAVIQWDVEGDQKIPEWQQEILEFYSLIEQIKKIVLQESTANIAVLFKTNDQIKKFASLMYQEDLSFTVQWKVAYEEDSLFLIFHTLMYMGYAQTHGLEVDSLHKILKFHYGNIVDSSTMVVEQFYEDWKLFDAYTSYVRFLNMSGCLVAHQAPFLDLLKTKAEQESLDFKKFLLWLDEIKTDEVLVSWTLPFKSVEKLNITLQTIHASKGLQYDHVLLARISMNTGQNKYFDTILAETSPLAFKQLSFLKTKWKTPQFYKELEENKINAKDEGLRLFYVACTRARRSLTLSLSSSVRAETWGSLVLDLAQRLKLVQRKSIDDKMKQLMQREVRLLPIFQAKIYKDWRTYFARSKEIHQDIKIIPSLSVTSLVVYQRCPQKFYFQNILNLEQHFEKSIHSGPMSSSQRGTKVHKLLQDYLSKKVNFQQALQALDNNVAKYFKTHGEFWLAEVSNANEVYIEQEIRFSWKGNIILGTPDLAFFSQETLQVWDFKTGNVDQEDRAAYLLQLQWYAYAVLQKYEVDVRLNKKIILKILALDQMETIEVETDYLALNSYLSCWWSSFFHYSTKKLSHCSKCSYQLYCDKNSI